MFDTVSSVTTSVEKSLPPPSKSMRTSVQYVETQGEAGEPAEMPLPLELLSLNDAWRNAADSDERARVWDRILQIHADQIYTIGIVCCTSQPVVVSNRIRGVPEKGIYSWDPGAYFGMYLPDTFWIDNGDPR